MPTYLGQVIGGTRLDLQGERLPRDLLDDVCLSAVAKRIPIHQHHNMALPVLGYMENLRVEADPNTPGEWSLIADLHLEEGSITEVHRGFSISTVIHVRQNEDANTFVHVPYPLYNDQELMGWLAADPELNFGKWIKKNADATAWALFGATLVLYSRRSGKIFTSGSSFHTSSAFSRNTAGTSTVKACSLNMCSWHCSVGTKLKYASSRLPGLKNSASHMSRCVTVYLL